MTTDRQNKSNEVTVPELTAALDNRSYWKALGIEEMSNFWLEQLELTHPMNEAEPKKKIILSQKII